MSIGQHGAGLSEEDPTVVTWCGLMWQSRAIKHRWNGAHSGPLQTFPLFVMTSIIFSKRKPSSHRVCIVGCGSCLPSSVHMFCLRSNNQANLLYTCPNPDPASGTEMARAHVSAICSGLIPFPPHRHLPPLSYHVWDRNFSRVCSCDMSEPW